jgi:hypothetical protein
MLRPLVLRSSPIYHPEPLGLAIFIFKFGFMFGPSSGSLLRMCSCLLVLWPILPYDAFSVNFTY